ncbi:hypothetical protein LTS08_007145 [Lithohypha guttulata]|nr:hypothetical protein LTS08_007145 [Lithohypha guttulata]
MPPTKILVNGAGISGSVLAFFLAKHSPKFSITVLERSRANQKLGQGLEIEEPALTVVKAMEIMDQLQQLRTGELGFRLVDKRARSRGYVGVNQGFSPTGALELMRGDLTEILYKAADAFENVNYRFESTVKSMVETEKEKGKVVVEIQKRGEENVSTEEFDLVVGADGVRSTTRQMVMGDSRDWYKPLGAYVAYFSIPKEDRDWPDSKACHFTNRRFMWLRPTGEHSKQTSAYLIHMNNNVPALHEANATGDRAKQKQALADLFSNCGWESKRVIEQMLKADNFYSDEIVQIKLPTWSKGRVALLGDAAWAPTPFTGQGNQLAIIGAWVLAQEISRDSSTIAFEKYEKRLREYVEECQQIPLGGYMPALVVPETRLGIWLFRTVFSIMAWFIKLTQRKKPAAGSGKVDKPFDLQMDKLESKGLGQ